MTMTKTVVQSRRRISLVEIAVVIGILVIMVATAIFFTGNYLGQPTERVPAGSQKLYQPAVDQFTASIQPGSVDQLALYQSKS